MSLTAIVLLTHANGLIQSQKTYWMNKRNFLAMQQAESLLEQFVIKDTATLSSADNLTENNHLYNGMRFNRTVTVTSNANGSKTVVVNITPVKAGNSGRATLSRILTPLSE